MARDVHKCLMELVLHSIAFREGYVLRSHLLHSVGRSAPNNFKEAVAPTPLLSSRQKWVNIKRFLERTSDLLQNLMQSIADVESKRPQLEREFREREKFRAKETEHAPTVQLNVTTEHRFIRRMVQGRASC